MDTIIYIILVPMVYLSFFIFIAGTAARVIGILRRPKFTQTLQMYPEKKPAWLWSILDTFLFPNVRKTNPILWICLIVFHLFLLLIILGHLELIKDFQFLQIVPHEIFLGGGYVGLVLSVVLLFFLFRRFIAPTKNLSVPEDYFLLILIFLTVIFGSEMDWARRWYGYGEMGVPEYRNYIMSLITLKPDISDVTMYGHSFMFVLHIFFANIFLMIFPFSKIMHAFFAIPLNKIRRG